ncbi:MAG TPA: T9SS type A sorting domain-containing protein, partial [Chitinophagales bacterium]|nr:T9SS type A sorting domain-containing protein [Chitinophagales bacterium]
TSPCAHLRLSNKITLGRENQFNTVVPAEVVVFVENEASIEQGSRVTADIFVHNGKLTVQQTNALKPNRMTGQFIAREVEARDFTYWYWNNTCSSSCLPPAAKLSSDEKEVQPPASSEIMLRAFPNPFSEKLTIEFTLETDSHTKLEIFNVSGQRLALLFEGNVKAGKVQRMEFSSDQSGDGMLIYRLRTEKAEYYGKAMMAK